MKTKLLSFLSAIIIGCVAVSCSPSDKDNAPTYPEEKAYTLGADEILELDFNVSQAFQLSCDATWMRFVSGDPQVERQTVSGDAGGNYKFMVLVKDLGQNFTDQTGTISMKFDGIPSKVLYTITRTGLVREAKMVLFDQTTPNPNQDTPLEVNKLDLQYANMSKYYFSFTANFNWKIKSQPEWLEELSKNTFGNAGDRVILTRNMNSPLIIADKLPFTQTGAFVLEDVNNTENTVTIPVTFDGMADDVVDFIPLNLRRGINISDMGKFMNQDGSFEDGKIISTRSRNMFIKVAHISYSIPTHSASEIASADSWVTCVENSSKPCEYSLSIDENTSTNERIMYLYFLPEKYKTDAYPYSNDFPNDFFQSSYGVKITQLGKPLPDVFTFSFRNFDGIDPTVVAPAIPFPDAEVSTLLGGFPLDKIYRKVFKASEWVEGKNLVIKLNGKPKVLGGTVVEDPGDGISTLGAMPDEVAKTLALTVVKSYSTITRTIVYFYGDEELILVLDKE